VSRRRRIALGVALALGLLAALGGAALVVGPGPGPADRGPAGADADRTGSGGEDGPAASPGDAPSGAARRPGAGPPDAAGPTTPPSAGADASAPDEPWRVTEPAPSFPPLPVPPPRRVVAPAPVAGASRRLGLGPELDGGLHGFQALAFVPGTRRLLSGVHEVGVVEWDLERGRAVRTLAGVPGWFQLADGLLLGREEKTLRAWTLAAGEPVARPPVPLEVDQFLARGQWLLTRRRAELALWDLRTGARRAGLTDRPGPWAGAFVDADGRAWVSHGWSDGGDAAVRLQALHGPERSLPSAVGSGWAGALRLAGGALHLHHRAGIERWRWPGGEPLPPLPSSAHAYRPLPGGGVVTLDLGDGLALWRPAGEGLERRLGVEAPLPVKTLAASEDGSLVVAGGRRALVVWDTDAGTVSTLPDGERRHAHPILAVAFGPAGRRLYTLDSSDALKAWSTLEGQLLWERAGAGSHQWSGAALRAGPRELSLVGRAGALTVLDPETGELLRRRASASPTLNRRVGPRHELMVELPQAGPGPVEVRDVASGDLLHASAGEAAVLSFETVVGPEDRLAAWAHAGALAVWDRDAGAVRLRVERPAWAAARRVSALALDPAGRRLAVARESSLEVWDLEARRLTGRSPPDFELDDPTWLDFGEDGRRLFVVGEDAGSVLVVDPAALEVLDRIALHTAAAVRVDPEVAVLGPGDRLLVGGLDAHAGRAHLLALAPGRGAVEAALDLGPRFLGPPAALALGPTGRWAAAGLEDGEVVLWDLQAR